VNDLLTNALAWHDAGYCVIPSHEDGSKRPFGPWKQYQQQRPTREQLTAWLTDGPYTAIGIIAGQVSGNVEMIEVERRAVITSALEFLGDHARHTGIEPIWTAALLGCAEQSGGGGVHMFVRVGDQPVVGNLKLASNRDNEVLAETRGEGGFVIVAPSPARIGQTGPYGFIAGCNPAQTPTLSGEELEELHNLLRVLDDSPMREQPPPDPRPTIAHTGLTPGDDFNATADWADILVPNGWTRIHGGVRNGHPITWWTRPGKSEGTSASTGGEGDWLYIFSTSTDLPDNQPLTKLYVYAHYHHNGDLNAAARQLARDGYGTPLTPIADLPPWLHDANLTPAEEASSDAASQWVSEHLQEIDWHALWADQTEEEWIIEPLLPARRLVALYSAPKVGKSLLMLELAAAVATGRPVLGTTPERRHVLYVDFENDPVGDIRTRLQDMDHQPEQLAGWLHYLSFPTLSALDSESGSLQLLAAVNHYQAEVVFIDTVSRSVKGEENENDTWLNFYRHTGLKLKQAGVALMRLDHSGKDETKGQRGGSAKVGDVDAVWRMKRLTGDDGEAFLLTCEAHRFQLDSGSDEVVLDRHTDPLRHEIRGGGAEEYRSDLAYWADALDKLECATDASRDEARAELKNAGFNKLFRNSRYPAIRELRKTRVKPFQLGSVPANGDGIVVPISAGTAGTGSPRTPNSSTNARPR
jgi:hypothetical protein